MTYKSEKGGIIDDTEKAFQELLDGPKGLMLMDLTILRFESYEGAYKERLRAAFFEGVASVFCKDMEKK